MKKLIFLLPFLIFLNVSAQKISTIKIRKFRVAVLSDSLRETSGLSLMNGKLYTFNDSGNPADIFEIDKKTGKILKVFKTGLQNSDWEALSNDEKKFYVGDFGNNAGTRRDLKIYKIPFENNQLKLDSAKTIAFHYPEQTDFSPKNLNNNFDAESLFVDKNVGLLHIFTKEWQSKNITHYLLNPDSKVENQPAQKLESTFLGFVATDVFKFQDKLFVVGYNKKGQVYLSIFRENQEGLFFKNQPERFYLGSALTIGQIEGIVVDDSGIYLSGEEFRSPLGKVPQSFYFIPMKDFGRDLKWVN